MSRVRTTAAFVLKSAVSAACIVLIARKIDAAQFSQDLARLHWLWLVAALGQFAWLPLLGGYRWRVVLDALHAPVNTKSAVRFFWVGMAFNQVLPSISGGDAVRVVLAWRQGVPLPLATQSVALERVAMFATLILLVALLQTVAGYQVPGPPYITLLLVAGTLGTIAVLLSADHLLKFLPPGRLSALAAPLAVHARRTFEGGRGGRLGLASLATHLNTALGCLWLGHGLGLTLHLGDFLFYVSLLTLISTLPLSIGGWGVREGAVVYLFGPLGIPSHTALAFSVLFGLSIAVISAVGVLFIWRSPALTSSYGAAAATDQTAAA